MLNYTFSIGCKDIKYCSRKAKMLYYREKKLKEKRDQQIEHGYQATADTSMSETRDFGSCCATRVNQAAHHKLRRCAKESITKVAEARHDVLLLIEAFIDSRGDDADGWMSSSNRVETLRACNYIDKSDVCFWDTVV